MFEPEKFLQDIVSEFIQANCEYPSTWPCEIERIEKLEKGVAIAAQLDHPEDGFYVKYVSLLSDAFISKNLRQSR